MCNPTIHEFWMLKLNNTNTTTLIAHSLNSDSEAISMFWKHLGFIIMELFESFSFITTCIYLIVESNGLWKPIVSHFVSMGGFFPFANQKAGTTLCILELSSFAYSTHFNACTLKPFLQSFLFPSIQHTQPEAEPSGYKWAIKEDFWSTSSLIFSKSGKIHFYSLGLWNALTCVFDLGIFIVFWNLPRKNIGDFVLCERFLLNKN